MNIIRRLSQAAELDEQINGPALANANGMLQPRGLELRPLPLAAPALHRPIDLLTSLGAATITGLDPAGMTPTRRLAMHWGLVKYVADLDGSAHKMCLTDDGRRYRERARGALSEDLGIGWSELAATTYLRPGCTYLDADHAGRRYWRSAGPITGIAGGRPSRRRPDYIAVDRENTAEIDLVETKGSRGPTSARTLASAALQLFGVEPARPMEVGRRVVTTIHGDNELTVANYEACVIGLGFVPIPRPLANEAGPDDSPPDHPPAPPLFVGPPGQFHSPQDPRNDLELVDDLLNGLRFWSGGTVTDDAARTRWSRSGREFVGMTTRTRLGGVEVTVRDGVAVSSMTAFRALADEMRAGLAMDSDAATTDERRAALAAIFSRSESAVETSSDFVVALGSLGTVVDVQIEG